MKAIILVAFVFAQFAFAGIDKSVTVTGTIVKFDDNTVTLSQRGQLATVPRKSIPKHFAIKLGNEVFAVMDSQELNGEPKKK